MCFFCVCVFFLCVCVFFFCVCVCVCVCLCFLCAYVCLCVFFLVCVCVCVCVFLCVFVFFGVCVCVDRLKRRKTSKRRGTQKAHRAVSNEALYGFLRVSGLINQTYLPEELVGCDVETLFLCSGLPFVLEKLLFPSVLVKKEGIMSCMKTLSVS